jgi:hypothetical protein
MIMPALTSEESENPSFLLMSTPDKLENLGIKDLHLKFRSLVSLIPAVLKHVTNGSATVSVDSQISSSPNVDPIMPPSTQRVLDVLATVLVREHEIVAVAFTEKSEVLVTMQFDPPVEDKSPWFLVGTNPRFKSGAKKKGKNREECHGWEEFRVLKPTSIVNHLDLGKPCVYAAQRIHDLEM